MIKNIILTSAQENQNIKGILNLETTSTKTLVNLKTYNFSKSVGKFLLGLKCGDNLFKVELSNDENYIINNALDLNQKISAVVVQIENNKSEILIWGSNETNKVWQNSFLSDFENKNEENNKELKSQSFQQNNFNFENLDDQQNSEINIKKQNFDDELNQDKNDFSDIETDEEIEKIVDQSLNEWNKEEENQNSEPQPNNKSEFLSSVEEQINELLNNYDEEKALEEIIPNSKFVKVNASGENFYIFGVIYENNEIKYIVYGIPGEFNVKPDDEYSNYYQWLPLDGNNPQGYGYYLMYQDALNGHQVEIILD